MKEILILPDRLEGRVWRYWNEGQPHPRHSHAELEVNFVTNGTGTYLLDNRTYALERRTMVWLFPEQSHVLLERSVDFVMWILVFTPDLVRRACTMERHAILNEENPPGHFCKRLSETGGEPLAEMCANLASEEPNLDLYNAGLSYALLSLWDAYLKADQVSANARIHPAVERAVHLIRRGEEPESLEQLAEDVGLSATRLGVLFKKQIGVSLVHFRNEQRIERFLRLYEQSGGRTMLEAAMDAGFGSYPQFYRVFQKFMGCAPGEYRRRV